MTILCRRNVDVLEKEYDADPSNKLIPQVKEIDENGKELLEDDASVDKTGAVEDANAVEKVAEVKESIKFEDEENAKKGEKLESK